MTTSTSDIPDSKYTLFPNPTSDIVFIGNLEEDVIIEIYDRMGKELYKREHSKNQNQIALNAMIKGLYLLKITVIGESKTTIIPVIKI